ncbi:MAG: helix-turn-helix transcriptional regulator [Candidatus Competibacteraceae bacterium]|nr:helix-turn-helix transcriptional regulator [Candidatus Competibacteraceae bacterium]
MSTKAAIFSIFPLEKTRSYFLSLLDAVIASPFPHRVVMAGPGPVKATEALGSQGMPRLNLLLEGSHQVWLDTGRKDKRAERQALLAGDAVFYPSYAPYLPVWREPGVNLGLVFSADFLRLVIYHHPGGPRLIRRSPFAWHSGMPLPEYGNHLLAALASAPRQVPESANLRSLVLLLIASARDHAASDPPPPRVPGKAARTWYDAERFLDLHLHEPLTREQVAEAAGVTPSYLTKLCEKQTGRPYQKHLLSLRLKRAESLLLHSSLSLAEVSRTAGFSNPRHFNDAFKDAYSLPPGAFRESGLRPG